MRYLLLPLTAVLLGSVAWPLSAAAQADADNGTEQGVKPDVKPDNTAVNKRDTNHDEPTADQQSNSMSDVRMTAKIRRAVMKDHSLSTDGHNVKIIVDHGNVTLKGPVANAAEKSAIERSAIRIAGRDKVTCELSVKQ